jgi:hypothetical protein
MLNLGEISSTLTLVVQASGLAEERPADAPSLLESTRQFADACSKWDSEQLSLESLMLQGCASEVDLLASSALKFFFQLESTMLQLESDIAASPSAQAWWTGQRLFEAASAIDDFLDAEPYSDMTAFPEKIYRLGAIRSAMVELSELLAVPVGGELGGSDHVVELLKAAQEKLKGDAAAELCARIWQSRREMDCQLQGLWFQTHGVEVFDLVDIDNRLVRDQTETDSAEAYAWAWNDLLMNTRECVTPETCYAAAERARVTADAVGLKDVAELLSEPKRVMYYGQHNILPPAPMPMRLSSAVEIEIFLKNELARWYFRPYRSELRPLDLAKAVFSLQRPLNYHWLLAHSLLQFHIIQACLPGEVEAGYLNVLITLAKSIDEFLAGYQLRSKSLPKLESADGWTEYLESLVHVHFDKPRTTDWTNLSNSLLCSSPYRN